jgi:hypothetical protein
MKADMNQDEIDKMDSGLGELRDRVGRLEAGLAENTEATKRIEASVASVVEFFQNATGAFKVLEGFGKLAKPVGYIAAAVASLVGVWTAFKSGFMR